MWPASTVSAFDPSLNGCPDQKSSRESSKFLNRKNPTRFSASIKLTDLLFLLLFMISRPHVPVLSFIVCNQFCTISFFLLQHSGSSLCWKYRATLPKMLILQVPWKCRKRKVLGQKKEHTRKTDVLNQLTVLQRKVREKWWVGLCIP